MQRLDLRQSLSQRLSPQQIQFIKLLQIPTAELETRIKEEMETNPALEEGDSEEAEREDDNSDDAADDGDDPNDALDSDNSTLDEDYQPAEAADDPAETADMADERPEPIEAAAPTDDETPGLEKESGELDLSDYLQDDDIAGYKMQGDGPGEQEEREMPLADTSGSLQDSLLDQLHFARLSEEEQAIGEQLIGSIDGDGYIRRDLSAIANDLAFSQNIEVSERAIAAVLRVVQTFDPPGIAARTLPECLLLQLGRRPHDAAHAAITNAERIIAMASSSVFSPHHPVDTVHVPKPISLTRTSVLGNWRYFMGES